MSEKTLLSVDQGTTSSRAILFSPKGKILALQQKELDITYPENGWVEQNPLQIWEDTLAMCRAVMSDQPEAAAQIAAIGITNQRETTILWDKETGAPIYNAIVWQDRRTAGMCADLRAQGHEDMIRAKTGLLLDPYFSATKIAWILNNVEGAQARAEAGDILFGTVDCYLLWKLTGGAVHATDATNASRTMIYNIVDQVWDQELLDLLGIPAAILPEVKDNVADYGETVLLGDAPLKIGGMAGDQQAALIGQACFAHGMVKSTYGTGCFALMNIGAEFQQSQNRLLTTIAYRLNGEVTYALEGSIFVAGAAIQWLRDGLQFFDDAAASEALATSVPDNGGVYFVPAFTGLGAPYWNPEARASITGLTRDASKAHITRAALEAQAYQSCDLFHAMAADSGEKPSVIRADGGLVANEFVCQFLSDMLAARVDIPHVAETTAWGAACLAGLSAGVFQDLDDISAARATDRSYVPEIEEGKRNNLLRGWASAVELLL